jgi:hypothetical protein
MPEFLADMAAAIAAGYARNPGQNFEKLIEFNLDFEDLDPPLNEDERHAVKFVVGKVFAANREEGRAKKHRQESEWRDHQARLN